MSDPTLSKVRPTPPRPARTDVSEQIKRVQQTSQAIIDEVGKVIVGKREVLELVTVNILSAGNILFEDLPGLAKSLMVNTFSRASGCDFRRIQFTPDLLPADITGIYMFNQRSNEFEFRPGPVFTNFLLADEINRAPPKTQAALLETMQERQVTVEGTTHRLAPPYVVMATQNPVEQEGTYPLPEAQMDRFLMKLSVGYPDREEEIEILRRRIGRGKDDVDVQAVTSPKQIIAMQQIVERVSVSEAILGYVSDIIQATRRHPHMMVGSSPRGSLALLKNARSYAALQGRDYVVPDDIKRIVVPSIAHRTILRPEPRIKGVRTEDIVTEIVRSLPVPKV